MRDLRSLLSIISILIFSSCLLYSQTPTATLNGRVLDPTRAVIQGATVDAINVSTNIHHTTRTNDNGLFVIVDLLPGTYRVEVAKSGFRTIVKPDITLHVQDVISLNFDMSIGSTNETVTVEAGAPTVDTQDATLGTVIDRHFADSLPLNGRSFQTLIQLTPGVVLTPSNLQEAGQFSVNGQRAAANYWTIDGVSANFGVNATSKAATQGAAGTLGTFSVQGGTNSLVSVDALQEFRISTSTYAPEFGRTPGGQISILTRSGTNSFHGTVSEYLRNNVFDANDWFANRAGQKKAAERQNDFGGTLGGPLVKDHTFFFLSYEGLRLRLPNFAQTVVPDVLARQKASAPMQPFLDAFPLPNGADSPASGTAQFNAGYSNRSSLDAGAIRVDNKLTDRTWLFGRYSQSPSDLLQRPRLVSLSQLQSSHIDTKIVTLGGVWTPSATFSNDLRLNYSRNDGVGERTVDSFGGANPLPSSSLPFPSPFTSGDSVFSLSIGGLTGGSYAIGKTAHNLQRQFNIVNTLATQLTSHSLKFGVDFRRLTPFADPPAYSQTVAFSGLNPAESGNLLLSAIQPARDASLLFKNLGVFAQDTWRAGSRITVTYGVRWDVDFAPSTTNGPNLLAVTNFNDLANLSLAPDGTPVFSTKYSNFAPRVGLAYQLRQSPHWETVVRGGFGIFYDLATDEVGEATNPISYPFGASALKIGGTFPLTAAQAAPPAISASQLVTGTLYATDPNLELPYTLEWNGSIEQSLGPAQLFSMSYVGSAGRRLIQTEFVPAGPGHPAFSRAHLTSNHATSDYDALQLQYQRQLSRGLQALASYSWAHSIDSASGSSEAFSGNNVVRQLPANQNRGSSDFDVRHSASAALSYSLPSINQNVLEKAIFSGWAIENVVQARSGTPVELYYGNLTTILGSGAAVRPDLVPGQALYLFGSSCAAVLQSCPGGMGFNPAAFQPPPLTNGSPQRQGNFGRNVMRGFGAAQWDFAVHRDFPIWERMRLQFRTEFFNLLNHPNFGNPIGNLNDTQFGRSIQMLGSSLDSSNQGGGSFSPLYQIGGPRSIQFAMKLTF